MSDLIFVGGDIEAYPYRLLGIKTVTPPEDPGDKSWLEKLFPVKGCVVLVSEEAMLTRPGDFGDLFEKLDPSSAMTIIPAPFLEESEHLRFIRLLTTRALGVDTWTARKDVNMGVIK